MIRTNRCTAAAVLATAVLATVDWAVTAQAAGAAERESAATTQDFAWPAPPVPRPDAFTWPAPPGRP